MREKHRICGTYENIMDQGSKNIQKKPCKYNDLSKKLYGFSQCSPYNTSDIAGNHQRIHTGEKPFKCPEYHWTIQPRGPGTLGLDARETVPYKSPCAALLGTETPRRMRMSPAQLAMIIGCIGYKGGGSRSGKQGLGSYGYDRDSPVGGILSGSSYSSSTAEAEQERPQLMQGRSFYRGVGLGNSKPTGLGLASPMSPTSACLSCAEGYLLHCALAADGGQIAGTWNSELVGKFPFQKARKEFSLTHSQKEQQSQQEPEDYTDMRDADEENLLKIRKPPTGSEAWFSNLHSALILTPSGCLAQQESSAIVQYEALI
ncbi:hypothetical protein U0070_011066 [Myodes glareolus]|uniref:C2H2-type domain-containing protein n=1 Tax=Myodes glareolus TaxID=447135 RepID=A0AAW0HJ09_MYOGA